MMSAIISSTCAHNALHVVASLRQHLVFGLTVKVLHDVDATGRHRHERVDLFDARVPALGGFLLTCGEANEKRTDLHSHFAFSAQSESVP